MERKNNGGVARFWLVGVPEARGHIGQDRAIWEERGRVYQDLGQEVLSGAEDCMRSSGDMMMSHADRETSDQWHFLDNHTSDFFLYLIRIIDVTEIVHHLPCLSRRGCPRSDTALVRSDARSYCAKITHQDSNYMRLSR